MKVTIIDYGMGNLQSIAMALGHWNATVTISGNPDEIFSAEKLILPGVGAFGDGMQNLRSSGLDRVIREAVLESKIPLLGICLGMQLLADTGVEGGVIPGLGLIPGEVKKLVPVKDGERIPHIGWNEVHQVKKDPIFARIPDDSDFYFVHSYHFEPEFSRSIIGRTPYCGTFVSAVNEDNIRGVQFHPEKSSILGLALIKNFLSL
ncbi:MAG: imidazole glycerol phosphate synthase subunit HisH [Methanoregula sp.]|nr:imidazole glycerol phosphate synthase subunit HisH [Methanoregula sp.]